MMSFAGDIWWILTHYEDQAREPEPPWNKERAGGGAEPVSSMKHPWPFTAPAVRDHLLSDHGKQVAAQLSTKDGLFLLHEALHAEDIAALRRDLALQGEEELRRVGVKVPRPHA